MNNQAFKLMVIDAVKAQYAAGALELGGENFHDVGKQLYYLFAGGFASGVKVKVEVHDWNEVPVIGTGMRIGPVVGDCIGYIHKGIKCTHVIMDVAQSTMDELTPKYISAFGVIECPHNRDQYCNVPFTGESCKGCEYKPTSQEDILAAVLAAMEAMMEGSDGIGDDEIVMKRRQVTMRELNDAYESILQGETKLVKE